MSCAQPQAEAVSLEQKTSFLLKIYIRPAVAEISPLSLGFKFGEDRTSGCSDIPTFPY